MIIKPYEERYRDDLIFMVLQVKDALGRVPSINEDLLHIRESYFDKGDFFWIAVNDRDRVIGSVGYSRIADTTEAFLHRLYVKASEKRQGLGSALLKTVEASMQKAGLTVSHVHLGSPPEQWFESYAFYPKHGYREYRPGYMKKILSEHQSPPQSAS